MLKNHLNHLKDNIFACFFKKYNRVLFFLKRLIFIKIYNNGSLSPKEENIIKDTRNLFRLKKEQNYAAVKDIRNLFRLHKEIKEIKDKVLRNIKNLLKYEKEEENYYKQVRVNNF